MLLDWASKVRKKYVSYEVGQEIHKAAEPFIKWLKEAEEEEDSDTDSEDDVEVSLIPALLSFTSKTYLIYFLSVAQIEYNDRPNAATLKAQPAISKTNASKANAQEDSEDDVDIDAI